MNTKVNMRPRFSFCLFLILVGLAACDFSDDISVTPHTLPGLFVTWSFTKKNVECPQSGTTINSTPSVEVTLRLKRDYTYELSANGQQTAGGSFTVDDENITFIPPLFGQLIEARLKYAFNGSALVITSREFLNQNGAETCTVKRSYIWK